MKLFRSGDFQLTGDSRAGPSFVVAMHCVR